MSRNEAEEAVHVVIFISSAFGFINRMLSEKPCLWVQQHICHKQKTNTRMPFYRAFTQNYSL